MMNIKMDRFLLDFTREGSFYDILDASCCKLVNDDFGRILTCVKDYCIENDIPHYHRVSHEGVLRHLLVRRARKKNRGASYRYCYC